MLTAEPNPFLTYTVQKLEDGTALFSWEFAVGEYLRTKGIQFGSDETLNQFMFPREDTRGPQDGTWLVEAIERARPRSSHPFGSIGQPERRPRVSPRASRTRPSRGPCACPSRS